MGDDLNKTNRTIRIVYGALSIPRGRLAQWWGVIRGRAERVPGYVVESTDAGDILAASNPAAAAWWRKHTPHLIGPRRYLLFHEHVCQKVDV